VFIGFMLSPNKAQYMLTDGVCWNTWVSWVSFVALR